MNLQDFEGVVSLLERDPKKATEHIVEFRENPSALQLCHDWICLPECSPTSKFQLALVLQYNTLKHWSSLNEDIINALRESLWTLITNSIHNNDMPAFALNKIIQVYVLLWKRGWKDLVAEHRESLFNNVSSFLSSSQQGGHGNGASEGIANPTAFRFGAILLRALVEEFNYRNMGGITLPLEFHETSHESFESMGLSECLTLSIRCLGDSFQSLDDSDNINYDISPITESVKLFMETMNWTFVDADRSSTDVNRSKLNLLSGNNDSSNTCLSLPRSWTPVIVQIDMIQSLFQIYTRTRERLFKLCVLQTNDGHIGGNAFHQMMNTAASSDRAKKANCEKECVACLEQMRNLMICMSSVSSGSVFFENDVERITYGDILLSNIVALMEKTIASQEESSEIVKASGNFAIHNVCRGEYDSFSSAILRILGNFRLPVVHRMPSFQTLINRLGTATYHLSNSISEQCALSVSKLEQNVDWNDEDSLFAGWKGDALCQLLDSWCMILDDPAMRNHEDFSLTQFSNGNGNESNSVLTLQNVTELRAVMGNMSIEVFQKLFESYYQSVLLESIRGQEEEEDEEEEEIHSRNKDALLMTIGAVGRASFLESIQFLDNVLTNAINQSKAFHDQLVANVNSGRPDALQLDGPQQAEILKILELQRVCILFICHVLVDEFSMDMTTKSSERPTIPQHVLDSFRDTASNIEEGNAIHKAHTSVLMALDHQLSLITAFQTQHHPLASPYLLEHLYRFFGEYYLRYIDQDASLYGNQCNSNNYFVSNLEYQNSHFSAHLESLLQYVLNTFVAFPLEIEVIKSSAFTLEALSKLLDVNKLDFILMNDSIHSIFNMVASPECPLNAEGLAYVYKALSCLVIRAKNETICMQLCSFIHSQISILTEFMNTVQAQGGKGIPEGKKLENKIVLSRCVSCLRGIAMTPTGLDKIIRELFDASLPILSWCVSFYNDHDDVMKQILITLRDYSENKLDFLPNKSATELYKATSHISSIIMNRIREGHARLQVNSNKEEEAYTSELILSVLQLLNILSTRDLFGAFDDDGDVGQDNSSNNIPSAIADGMLADVLVMGFVNLVPIITSDLLRCYTLTCERYFTYVVYIISSFSEHFMQSLQREDESAKNSNTNGNLTVETLPKAVFFDTLVQHLLWGASGVDSVSARSALQAIQKLADFHYGELRANSEGLGHSSNIFPLAMYRLLEIIFFPKYSEHGMSWDRVEFCAHALMTLIVLDNNQFMTCAQEIVLKLTTEMGYDEQTQQSLLHCFEKLVTDREVALTSVDRKNRLLFGANFKDFVLSVRPLVAA